MLICADHKSKIVVVLLVLVITFLVNEGLDLTCTRVLIVRQACRVNYKMSMLSAAHDLPCELFRTD